MPNKIKNLKFVKKKLLENFPKTVAPMVNMALRLGVSYQEFDLLMKQVFIEESNNIIGQQGKKITEASVSAVSGISRMTMSKMSEKTKTSNTKPWVSFPNRIIATWVSQDLDTTIAYSDKEKTDFITLAQGITTEKSTRTILNEMLRLNLVTIDNNKQITLVSPSERSSNDDSKQELLIEFSDNLQAHAQAGVSNLNDKSKALFLEESVKVDGIHLASAEQLSAISIKAWKKTCKTIIQAAQPISDKEEKENAQHKLTFGVYCYYE